MVEIFRDKGHRLRGICFLSFDTKQIYDFENNTKEDELALDDSSSKLTQIFLE